MEVYIVLVLKGTLCLYPAKTEESFLVISWLFQCLVVAGGLIIILLLP